MNNLSNVAEDQSHRRGFAKKVCLLLTVLLLVMFVFTSCGKEVSDLEPFRVGMECGYSPYNWTQLDDSNGGIRIDGTDQFANGYDVQIAKRVADDLGKELVVVKSSWEGLIPGIDSGHIDAIAAGMSATDERKLAIDFSEEYYFSNLVVVLRNDGPYTQAKNIQDLSGARLTGQMGTTHFDVIDQIEGVKKHVALDDFPAMLIALQAGTIDGYVSEKPGAISATAANPDLTFIEFQGQDNFQFDDQEVSIGMGLKKGNPLLPKINASVMKITMDERDQIMLEAISNQPNEGERASFWVTVGRILNQYSGHFIKGAGTTLFIAIIGTIAGLIIGLLIATFRLIPTKGYTSGKRGIHKVISFFLTAYVEIIRGTPMMVQSIVFYYGFKHLTGVSMSTLMAGILIVSFNTGAYMTEVVRGGIDAVDKGQFEATKAIGMTHGQSMKNVILPQAIRNILPATGNEFVINIKDTSVLNVIAVTELFYAAKDVQTNTLAIFPTYFVTAVIYFVLTFTITRILHVVERKMDGPQNYMLTSSSYPTNVKVHQKQGGN